MLYLILPVYLGLELVTPYAFWYVGWCLDDQYMYVCIYIYHYIESDIMVAGSCPQMPS